LLACLLVSFVLVVVVVVVVVVVGWFSFNMYIYIYIYILLNTMCRFYFFINKNMSYIKMMITYM
jgi:hypothetical protein